MSNIPDLQLFPSDGEHFSCPKTPTVATHVSSECMDPNQETPSERFGHKIQHSYKPHSRRLLSPPPSRSPVTAPHPSLHPAAAIPPIPPISKWSVTSLCQALSNSDIYFRSSKAQLYDLLPNSNNSTSIPKNSSTPKKKTQSSSISVSSLTRCSECVQCANPEAAAKTRGRKTSAAHTSGCLSARPTTVAAKNSYAVPPVLTNSVIQVSPLPRQDQSIPTFPPVLSSAAPTIFNYFSDNPCTTSSQTVTFFSPPLATSPLLYPLMSILLIPFWVTNPS